MKKSNAVVLGVVMAAAVSVCKSEPKDQWIKGDNGWGGVRGTTVGSGTYRHNGSVWYPIFGGMISSGTYRGVSSQEIASPGFVPRRASGVRSGGIGSS